MEKYKKVIKNNKFKISVPTWNENLIYLMDRVLCQMCKITLNISLKTRKKTANPSISI